MYNPMPSHEREIVAVSVRRGWRGRLILTICRRCERLKMKRPTSPAEYEPAGVTPWRDANADDPAEVAEIVQFLGTAKQPYDREKGPVVPMPTPARFPG